MRPLRHIYFYLSLVSGLWFALTAPAWSYLANMFISLPFGLLSYVLWQAGRRKEPHFRPYGWIPWLWIAGGLLAAVSLVYYLVFE